MSQIETIGVLGYHHCSEQDTVTTWEILRGCVMVLEQDGRALDLKLLGMEAGQPIEMQMGLKAEPEAIVQDDDLFDLLYVPGGVGTGAAGQDERILQLIRRHHQQGKVLASNCSGIGILHRAGVVGDREVTCVAAIARRLREEGGTVAQPRPMWLGLPEHKLWTTVGAAGVNGSTVALCGHYFGRDVAKRLGMMFDTYGVLGESIYDLRGPELFFHPELETEFQGIWEDELLPRTGAAA